MNRFQDIAMDFMRLANPWCTLLGIELNSTIFHKLFWEGNN